MGAVYKAVDTQFNNRPVAIKEMSSAGLSPNHVEEAKNDFAREAHILSDLLHPNLPRIYDNFTGNDRSYLVMDFIEGQALEEYVEQANGSPLPLEQVLGWGIQLCDVLGYLHNRQPPIIFRDLKPSNVMVSENGHVYLIDFGIARVFKPGQSHDTVALGSPGYAAPEQYGKAQSTPRSDLYSLGALLHCMLTGVDPSEQPFFFRFASELNPAVPYELSELLQRMLSMDSDKRPASAQEVLKTLRLVDQQRISGTLSSITFRNTNPAMSAVLPGPGSRELLRNAYNLYSQKRVKEALTLYDQVVQTDSLNAEAWQGRGLTQALNSQHQEALESFTRALQINPSSVTALNGQGAALNLLRRNREALEVFEKASILEPNNPISWNGKGAAQSALGQPHQALTSFDVALQFDPRMAQAWNNKGLVLRQLRRYDQALYAFEQALKYEPAVVAYYNGKALVLYEMGRLKDAAQTYREALTLNDRYAPAWLGMGNVLYVQRKWREALESYDRALQIDRNFARAWDRRGSVLTEMGQYAEALKSYDRALQIDPRNASAWNGKGRVLSDTRQYGLAINAYNQALRINANAPMAWNGKANAFYHLNQFGESLNCYERALQLNPRMSTALHNKSLVLYHMDRFEDALAAAETAIRYSPNDPDNWDRKADALKRLRLRKEAREAETQAARLRGM
jgi:tetratricopeptide (TPR) repeat protein